MKKIIYISMAGLLMAACQKNNNTTATTNNVTTDTTPPALTLSGRINDTMSLNSTYPDPGAVAIDNVDGNISTHVIVTGSLNKDLVGEYRLYYNVKDAAGNSAVQLTRYVYVANDADYLVGNYMTASNCGASGTYADQQHLSASTTVNNQISLGLDNETSQYPISVFISGSSVTIPLQGTGNETISGSGTIAPNKKSFTLNVNSNDDHYGNWVCSSVYTKQ